MLQKPRNQNAWEKKLFSKLCTATFDGRDQIASQLSRAMVREIDEYGGLEIKALTSPAATVSRRIPVEAKSADIDGVTIHYLLHVVDGFAIELEIYKDDGSPIKRQSPVEFIELI